MARPRAHVAAQWNGIRETDFDDSKCQALKVAKGGSSPFPTEGPLTCCAVPLLHQLGARRDYAEGPPRGGLQPGTAMAASLCPLPLRLEAPEQCP